MVKDSPLVGNSLPVLRLALWLLVVAASSAARAEACPPVVTLEGDSHAIDAVGEVLAARGISLHVANCEAVRARLETRAEGIAIELTQLDGTKIERMVGDAATAATVIESFTRSDVGDPLLASRPLPPAPERPATDIDITRAQAAPRSPRGVRLSSAIETSFGSDRTRWTGIHLGACIMLGPICAGGRLRGAGVVWAPWAGDVERNSTELLAGIDIPFALRSWTFTPGFAAGLGHMDTRIGEYRIETGGVRADVHATLSLPLWRKLALDVFAAADLTQETRGVWGHPEVMMMQHGIEIPAEPRLLVRLGLGLSYGGL